MVYLGGRWNPIDGFQPLEKVSPYPPEMSPPRGRPKGKPHHNPRKNPPPHEHKYRLVKTSLKKRRHSLQYLQVCLWCRIYGDDMSNCPICGTKMLTYKNPDRQICPQTPAYHAQLKRGTDAAKGGKKNKGRKGGSNLK